MNDDIRDRIKRLEITFDSGWTWKVWEDITDICRANEWKSSEVIDGLPEKYERFFCYRI